MMGLLLALCLAASAADLSDADARRVALLFYQLTGRVAPDEAFLADDIDALAGTGRDAAELERAVRWIAANVDGAGRYTLGGILESHLATALGEEEIVKRPDPEPERPEVLAIQEKPPRYDATVAVKQAVLEDFYGGTGREAPSPPRDEDLAAFDALAREGWSEAGLRLLGAWVPVHVKGAEQLTFAQVARVAIEKGYNGGPQPNGRLEELAGVRTWPQDDPGWEVPRDPYRFDGGGIRGMATFGALPSMTDLGVHAAWLPGTTLRLIELRGQADSAAGGAGGGLVVGQATGRYGFVGELVTLGHPVGALDADRIAFDGGPTRQLADPAEGRSAAGRFAIARGGAIPVGVNAYGWRGPDHVGGGALVSAAFQPGPRLSILTELGAGGVREPAGELEVAGPQLTAELAPRLTLGPHTVTARARLTWSSGGLVDDAFPVAEDLYSQRASWMELAIRREEDRWGWGAGVSWDRVDWQVDWLERDRTDEIAFNEAALRHELETFGGAQVRPLDRVWLYGGARLVVDPARGAGLDGALAASYLFRERAWLSAAARGGSRGTGLQVAVGMPF
ncbi:MAG: hypothetical protein H6739_39190 [Alphaproteobacteria bacterium]|nr:hypothetical protein [Alphaproteobacteria bacterium]